MSAPQPGDRINNYLLDEWVGGGSFGQVWRAHHHVFDEQVAVKIPVDPDYVQNLRREGVAIHGLRHPNIVRAIDLDPYADPPYFIMEYVPGDSLRQIIDKHANGLPVNTAVAVMQGILSALGFAHHSGMIHRDIKPANILITERADALERVTPQSVKVADFGLGRAGGLTAHSIMQSGSMLTEGGRSISGTVAYMSPEQKEGQELDPSSDLYACGIVLFEMLTGERPQGAEMPSSLRPDVPTALDEVFKRCYARRERRFSTASEMLDALASPSGAPRPRPAFSASGSKCPSCHEPVQHDDQFCIRCGCQLVEAVPRCNQCKAFVHLSDRYCIFCGSSLTKKVG